MNGGTDDAVGLSEGPDLSICIPTFNRAAQLEALLRKTLAVPGAFDVHVHIDGSTDRTIDLLRNLAGDPRLHFTSGENAGRARALRTAVLAARGRFVMLYDDDDELFPDGLAAILEDCKRPLPIGVAGYIYHMDLPEPGSITPFPSPRSNFIKLRADDRVRGDKKEVVLTRLLQSVVAGQPQAYRRVPTSYYWATLAVDYDVLCRNLSVGRKDYLPSGMTSRIGKLKRRNAAPLAALYRKHASAFVRGRYGSLAYLARAVLGIVFYGALSAWTERRKEAGGQVKQ